MRLRIIFVLTIIHSLFACKQSSNQADNEATTNDTATNDTATIDMADVPKHWTHLSEWENGEYLVFNPCDGGNHRYRIEKKEEQWVLYSEGSHDIVEYTILNAQIDEEGSLVFLVKAKHSGGAKETNVFIRDYENNKKSAKWDFPIEDSYETYVNESGIREYRTITQPCYECVDYCPEENPDFYKTIDVPSNRQIKPGLSVGDLNYKTTPTDITSIFPEKSIIAHEASPFDNEITHIQLSKGNNLFIHWTEKPYRASQAVISGDNSDFRTKEGIGIGSTIEEVEKALWTGFQIYGFEIDRDLAGTVIKWNNPEYNHLKLKFKPKKELPVEQYKHIMGADPIPSSFHVLRDAGLVVEEITTTFHEQANTGEKLYSDSGLEIFDNKAYYNKNELYNGVRKWLSLIESDETEECPVDYDYYYYPLSLIGNYYSYEQSENGTVACGIPTMYSTIRTIDITTNKEVEIQDVFMETSIVNALKNDSWVISKVSEYQVDADALNSIDDVFSFIESMDISITKTSFAVLGKGKKPGNVLVRIIGFRQNPIDKVVLGLSLEVQDKDNVQNLKFTIGSYASAIFQKR